MKNNKNYQQPVFRLTVLVMSLYAAQSSVYAMQLLDDSTLRQVNGQDGVHVSTTYDAINVDKFYWEDNAGIGGSGAGVRTQANLQATAEGFKIQSTNANVTALPVANRTLGTDYKINIGSDATTGKTGLDLTLRTNPSLITIDKFKICDTESTQRCGVSVGNLAIQTSSIIDITFKTRDGLFSKDKQASLFLGLQNANIYLGQIDASNQLNQLILKNFNFNFLGKGVMFVDSAEGFKLQTNVFGKTDAALIYNTDGSINYTSSTKPSSDYGYVDFTRVVDSASASLKNTGSYGDAIGSTTSNGASTTNSGLNLEILTNTNVTQTSNATKYALDNTNTPTNAKGLIRVGASGRMVNGYLQLRGIDTTGKTNPIYGTSYGTPDNSNIVGTANNLNTDTKLSTNNPITATGNNIIGSTGIAFKMAAQFTKDDDPMLDTDGNGSLSAVEKSNATTLEIGGAGLNTYGFEFGNLTGLLAKDRGSFSSGNVYINLADTKTVLLPANKVFQTSRFGSGSTLTSDSDYFQYIYKTTPTLPTTTTGTNSNPNPYSLLVAIRGAEFQAVSRRGRFTNSARTIGSTVPNIAEHTDNSWGLALPFYNLNANIAIFGTNVDATTAYAYTPNYYGGTTGKNQISTTAGTTTPRLGFSLGMTTQGISDDGTKTTSIMVIDGAKLTNGSATQTTDYYIGLRNIDMMLKGTGSIGVEKGSFNVSLQDMLMVMSAQVAAGYLPGTKYKTCFLNSSAAGCSTASQASTTSFQSNNDVLFGIKLRAGGNMNFSLIPNSEYKSDGTGNRMNIVGDFTLDSAQNNTIQISDPIDGSIVALDNLTGKLAFNNAIVIAPKAYTDGAEGVVSFNTALTFNPDRTTDGVFRAKDINLYPATTTANNGAQRLGELAITGGRLTSQFSIMPRN